jgi:Rrf2 family iron-sulfur cluster assembly transcriptional regulator
MLSKTGKHALLALAELAKLPPAEYAGAGQIAEATGAPPNYLGKLLKQLAGEGLLVSQKGYGGGFRLARAAVRISLYDVIEPIEHVSRWQDCFMSSGKCDSRSPCAVHDKWKSVREEYLKFLKNTALADIASRTRTVEA